MDVTIHRHDGCRLIDIHTGNNAELSVLINVQVGAALLAGLGAGGEAGDPSRVNARRTIQQDGAGGITHRHTHGNAAAIATRSLGLPYLVTGLEAASIAEDTGVAGDGIFRSLGH